MRYFSAEEKKISIWKKLVLWAKIPGSLSRFLLASFFLFFLTAALYFRDVHVEELKPGSVAGHFIVSQTDFEFLDEQKMHHLKQQARFNIGPIYRLDNQALFLQLHSLKDHFKDQEAIWKSRYPKADLMEIDHILASLARSVLKARFTDGNTLEKTQELAANDFHFSLLTSNPLPPSFWQYFIENNSDARRINKESMALCAQHLDNVSFPYVRDLELETQLQNTAENKIKDIYVTFKAGTILLQPGEKITERHIYILKAMKESLDSSYLKWDTANFVLSFVVAILTTSICIVYLRVYYQDIFFSFKKLALLVCILGISLAFGKLTELTLFNVDISWRETVRYPAIYAFSMILITLLISRTIALFSLVFLLVFSWLFFAFDAERFSLMNLIGGLAAILACQKVCRRRHIFYAGIKVWFSIIPLIGAFHFVDGDLNTKVFCLDILGDFLYLACVSLVAIFVLPFVERIFNALTNMSLMEYMDSNHELLRRLSIEVPGTYQHSLVASHIAEAAARSIHANDLFCRVVTLYHDIGKMHHPQYFTENQMGGFNIHQLLTPRESTQAIHAHVSEGVMLAKKYKLPIPFVDIIQEHHGTTLVCYFYNKELEFQQKGDAAVKVDPLDFRYKGPKPKTKESAIIMIADCVEAASRCLEAPTEQTIEQLVERIIREKEFDGQFDECQITFEELGKVRKAIVKALMISHHIRIKYPQTTIASREELKVSQMI